MTETEFSAVAYAFMGALARLGAGNPKGVKIHDDTLVKDTAEPWIVVDAISRSTWQTPCHFRRLLQALEKRKISLKRLLFQLQAVGKKQLAN